MAASTAVSRSRAAATTKTQPATRRPLPVENCGIPAIAPAYRPAIRPGSAALLQRAQGLGERPLQPGEVVGLAVMVRRELVGPADSGVPYVFAGPLDEGPDVPETFGVGHRPVAAAGDVDRRGMRENPAAPFIEVVIDTERSAGYPRVPVDPQFLADFGLPSAARFGPRNDLAVT